jgi:hypothetical protein
LPHSNHREYTPCAQEHSNKHTHALHHSNHCDLHLVHKNTQTSTRMHCLAAITVSMPLYKPKHTLPNTHASPRSNHSAHAPSISPNTHSHTRMHCLAAITASMLLVRKNTQTSTRMHHQSAITVSMCLVQAQTHTLTHAYQAIHQPRELLHHKRKAVQC